jgi:hypothetical protein
MALDVRIVLSKLLSLIFLKGHALLATIHHPLFHKVTVVKKILLIQQIPLATIVLLLPLDKKIK